MKEQKKKHAFCLSVCSILLFLPAFLMPSSLTDAQEAVTKLKVVMEMANIRLKPDVGSIITQQVPQGTILESSAKEGEWYLVKIKTEEGQTVSGYVHESVVAVLEGPAQEKEKIEIKKIPETELKKELEIEKAEKAPVPKPAPAPAAPQPSKFRIEFSFSGGTNFVSAGDLNNGAEGAADWRDAELDQTKSGTFRPAHLSYILGGELAFSLTAHLYLGLGADYFRGEKESVVKFLAGPVTTEILTVRPKFQALPLRLFLAYQPFPFFYLKGGLEYCFAKCSYLYNFQRADFLNQEGKAKARGLGLVGAIGLERKLSPALSFLLEVAGRYAKIKGFKGTHTETDYTGAVTTEEGKLYYFYRREAQGEPSYPQLYIRKNPPTGAEYDPREAVIDFSGLSLKAGFKIKF